MSQPRSLFPAGDLSMQPSSRFFYPEIFVGARKRDAGKKEKISGAKKMHKLTSRP